MARTPRPRLRATIAWTGSLVVAAAFIAGAAIAQGYDAENVPTLESNVWVARDASGGQYARFNTDVGEIQTVNDAKGAGAIAQTGSAAYVFSKGYGKYWSIDSASPVDIGDQTTGSGAASSGDDDRSADAAAGVSSPTGADGVVTAGPYLLFTGPTPSWGRADDVSGQRLTRLDPYAANLAPSGASGYSASVSTISRSGLVAMYSSQDAERRVLLYDTVRGAWTPETIDEAPDATVQSQLTMVGDEWVLLAGGSSPKLWVSGRADPFDLSQALGGAVTLRLQAPGAAADSVVIATEDGLDIVRLADGRVTTAAAAGTPAQPEPIGDGIAAAWLGPSSGAMWTTGMAEPMTLPVEPDVLDGANVTVTPVIASNGDRAVLLEQTTGMLWTIPDGTLVPTEAWDAGNPPPQQGHVVVQDASQEEPPVAEDDDFGVRAGGVATLSVLDNDHDANASDVLSIDPASVEGLDPAFGSLTLSADDQAIIVQVTGAVPTGTFTYKASDGVSDSATAATVTLTVKTGESPPQWCGEVVRPACLIEWPQPQIAVGGTASFDVLKGWIDPEGDAIAIAAATPQDGAPIVALPSADGRLAIGAEAGATPGVYRVAITVMDARGAVSAPKELDVTVAAVPGFALRGGVVVGTAGVTSVAQVGDYASGGSGAFQVTDVIDISPTLGEVRIDRNEAAGTISLEADKAGEYIVTMTVKDAATPNQLTANLRFSVLPPDQAGVSIPPMTAFVRSGQDTLVDVLSAVQNTTDRVLLVTSATPDTGSIVAAVSGSAAVQLRSSDPGLPPGPLGSVQVALADAEGRTYAARIAVFLVAPSGNDWPIALPDAVTVRAGQVVDVPVLENDVAPYGERLSLSPDIENDGPADGLAFVSGSHVRILAPQESGTYLVYYYAYLESDPEKPARSQVAVQVLPAGSNRAPQAVALNARGAAGQSITVAVPTTGMDPDGDPVVVSAVTQPDDPALGAVQIGADGESLVYYAPEINAQQPVPGWQAEFTYTVKDAFGLESTAAVRVAVTAQDLGEAPLVFSDHVRVKQVAPGGEAVPVTVEPLLNDSDPGAGALGSASSGHGLHILYAVAPDAPGDASDADSPAGIAAQLIVAPGGTDTSSGAPDGQGTAAAEVYPDGKVRFRITDRTQPGTYLYLYTVESLRTLSTAQGLIVVTVSPGDAPDQPTIDDTVVTAQTRDQVTNGGIDVLTGRVVWPIGDPQALYSTLQLAPGAPRGFSVAGDSGRITGPLPRDGAVVPFQVSGTDASGDAFTAYGLLRIPALDDYRLAVVTPPDPIRETTTGDIALQDILNVGPGDTVEVRPDSTFATHRSTADPSEVTRCDLKGGSGSTLEYHASYFPGNSSDTCTIVARIAGQSDAAWTALVVPIEIEPLDPLAQLTPATRTISIVTGAESLNLYRMLVTWTGGLQLPDLTTMRFSWVYSGSEFGVSPASGTASPNASGTNAELTVKADADARPGTRETLQVTVTYPYPPRPGRPTPPDYRQTVNVALIVGMAPSQSPTGANLTLACNAKDQPAGCDVLAILPGDGQGQFNPITAENASGDVSLRLAGLSGTAQRMECPGLATASVEGDRVQFAWLAAPDDKFPGGTCTVPFTVVDRQGRTGTGQILFNASGYPQAPSTPVTAAYTGDSVTIDVPLGAAAQAHPDLTAVRLYDADSGAEMPGTSCARQSVGSYRCLVTGLANGVVRHIAAAAVNDVGESVHTAPLTTNAYLAPAVSLGPNYDDQVYVAGTTTASQGVVKVNVCAEHGVKEFRFASSLGSVSPSVVGADANGCVATDTPLTVPAGVNTITVTPVSSYSPPQVGSDPRVTTGSPTTKTVYGRGRPSLSTQPTLAVNGAATQVIVSYALNSNYGDQASPNGGDGTRGGTSVHVLAWNTTAGAAAPTCSAGNTAAGTGGGLSVNAGGAVEASGPSATQATFPIGSGGLTPNDTYRFVVCASYGYGYVQSSATSTVLFRKPAAPTASDMTYTPTATPSNIGDYYTAPTSGDGPAFSWGPMPDADSLTNNAAPDFAAQQSTLPPPSGGSWRTVYGTSTGGAFTAASITDSTKTWYAKFCFTSGGQDYCSDPSAPIVSDSGSVGIPPSTTGSATLPTAATCQAALSSANSKIDAEGESAFAAKNQAIYDNAYAPVYAAQLHDLRNASYDAGVAAFTAQYPDLASYQVDHPGATQDDYDAAKTNAGVTRQSADEPANEAAADSAAQPAGNAAVAADAGAQATVARRQARDDAYADQHPTAPAIRFNGFSGTPFATPSAAASGVDTDADGRPDQYRTFDYDFGSVSANTPFGYVLQAIKDYLDPRTTSEDDHYRCGS